jgi:hypothetical protein
VGWLGLLNLILSIFSTVSKHVADSKLISQAEKAQLADQLLAEAENVDRAFKARLAQRMRDAGGVSDEEPDRFRRD